MLEKYFCQKWFHHPFRQKTRSDSSSRQRSMRKRTKELRLSSMFYGCLCNLAGHIATKVRTKCSKCRHTATLLCASVFLISAAPGTHGSANFANNADDAFFPVPNPSCYVAVAKAPVNCTSSQRISIAFPFAGRVIAFGNE
jgi:hypothetical protein